MNEQGAPLSQILFSGTDPMDAVFQRIRQAVPSDIDSGVCAVGRRRGVDSDAELQVVVLDPQRDWDFVEQLCAAGPTLVVAPAVTTEDALVAIDLGARGCLDATVSSAALGAAIRGIIAGEVAFSRAALGAWLRRQAGAQSGGANARLTPRQRQVVALIARGAADKEIAGTLGIATATAQKHVANLLARLGAPNRAAAVALTTGLLQALTTRSH
ncbi:MAG TPA: hypothetical protein DCK98_16440 [Chloroflexi bacterium]|jgi:DNA-binding NarL/FixJ family response regulator|nr:hypothetical protein [Chloroflexota bacterium]HAL25128.1 hypothetical protein [Chloroflexota bacterium]